MGNVINFFDAKKAKAQVSHRVDKIKELKKTQDNDLDERIARIKASIARINTLMAQLREEGDGRG